MLIQYLMIMEETPKTKDIGLAFETGKLLGKMVRTFGYKQIMLI